MGFLASKSKATKIDRSKFDLTNAADKYSAQADAQFASATERQQAANQANQQLVQQLQAQASGTTPSLAQAQLRSNTNRNLAQTMAAAAAQRGSNPALQQRQLLQQKAAANRDVAAQASELGIQERQASQGLLANQLSGMQTGADQVAQNANQAGFGYQNTSKQLAAQGEGIQSNLTQQTNMANAAAANAMTGALVGGAAKIGGAMATGGASAALAHGGVVEGPEVVEGDSLANDVVPVKASAGELVVPKSVVSKGPVAVKRFAELLLEQDQQKPAKASYASVAAARSKKV